MIDPTLRPHAENSVCVLCCSVQHAYHTAQFCLSKLSDVARCTVRSRSHLVNGRARNSQVNPRSRPRFSFFTRAQHIPTYRGCSSVVKNIPQLSWRHGPLRLTFDTSFSAVVRQWRVRYGKYWTRFQQIHTAVVIEQHHVAR